MMSNTLDGYIIIMTVNYMFSNQPPYSSVEGYFFKDNSIYTNNPQFERDLAMYALNKADLVPCRAIKVADGSYACYRSDTGAFLTNISEDNFHIFVYNSFDTAGIDMKKGYLLIRVGRKILNGVAYQENKIFFIQTDELNITDNLLSYINAYVYDNSANPLYIQKSLIPCMEKISHNANGIYYFYDIQTVQEIAHYQGVNVHVLQYKG